MDSCISAQLQRNRAQDPWYDAAMRENATFIGSYLVHTIVSGPLPGDSPGVDLPLNCTSKPVPAAW